MIGGLDVFRRDTLIISHRRTLEGFAVLCNWTTKYSMAVIARTKFSGDPEVGTLTDELFKDNTLTSSTEKTVSRELMETGHTSDAVHRFPGGGFR